MAEEATGWVMAISIIALCTVILALVYVPGFAPSAEALDCDRQGGYWSKTDRACHMTDSPAAGLAA